MKQTSIVIRKYGLSIYDKVISFHVKTIIIDCKVISFEVIFDDESHVAKGQVYVISKNNPIIRVLVNSIPEIESKFGILHIKISKLHLVAPKFTARGAAINSISFNDE